MTWRLGLGNESTAWDGGTDVAAVAWPGFAALVLVEPGIPTQGFEVFGTSLSVEPFSLYIDMFMPLLDDTIHFIVYA